MRCGITVPLLVLAGAGMVALAWPLTRLVAGVGQTSSQGLAPIAHTLAAFGPGLLGYGLAFIMTRVLFALGDVRRASILMVAGAVVGVVTMVVASAWMAPIVAGGGTRHWLRRRADRRRRAAHHAGAPADRGDGRPPGRSPGRRVSGCPPQRQLR